MLSTKKTQLIAILAFTLSWARSQSFLDGDFEGYDAGDHLGNGSWYNIDPMGLFTITEEE